MKSRIGIIIDPKATTDHTTSGQRRHPDHGQSHIKIVDGKGGVHALVERVHTTLFSDTSRHNVLKVLSKEGRCKRNYSHLTSCSLIQEISMYVFHFMISCIRSTTTFPSPFYERHVKARRLRVMRLLFRRFELRLSNCLLILNYSLNALPYRT